MAIIPARLRARRLQDKPLQNLAGEPIIWRVYRQVARCPEIAEVWVAGDHPSIIDAIERRGGRALLVPEACHSGTERVALANRTIGAERVINVQGDEPFVGPDLLKHIERLTNHASEEKIARLAQMLVDLGNRLSGTAGEQAAELLESWKHRSAALKLKIYHMQQGLA